LRQSSEQSGETAGAHPVAGAASAPAALARFVTRQLDVLASIVPRVLATEDPDAVHDLRVATRRLQEALCVLTSTSPSKRAARVRRTLRRGRRALGSWRNLDVSLQEVNRRRRATRSPRRRAAWNLVREYLEQRRVEETIDARKRLVRVRLRDIRTRAAPVVERLLRGMPPESAWHSIRNRIDQAWGEWQRVFSAASASPAVAAVHALRIATKRLRYRVEIARELDAAGAEPVLHWARGVQQTLGDWHDGQVLHQLVAEALAHPETLLARLETVQYALAELDRDRRQSPPLDTGILARVPAEEGRAAVETCLARLKARP
jgi:CHAD domain-containing protein